MILFSAVKHFCLRLDRVASEHLTQQQLRRLEPRLLDDIGLRLENGRVVAIDAVGQKPHSVPLPIAVGGVETSTDVTAQGLQAEPEGGGG